ncbi:hypothetical protein [Neotabrizicola sp. VNH66]|uniref:hypothetical protein n=1 Tax=Neotabrizicola sp. VNH66 TaxID=3400918 RepID=UPI003C0C60A3
MRLTLAAFALAGLSACVDPLAIDPTTGIELMKGMGSASVSADGSRSFRYVLPPQAGTDKAHHQAMIAQWAASADGCPKGYTIAKVEVVQGATVYSGPCR